MHIFTYRHKTFRCNTMDRFIIQDYNMMENNNTFNTSSSIACTISHLYVPILHSHQTECNIFAFIDLEKITPAVRVSGHNLF